MSYWSDLSSAEDYFNTQRIYNPVAEKFAIEYYQQVHPTWRIGQDKIPLIVDLGCGSGQLSGPMSKYCDKLIGIDVSEAQIATARRHNTSPNIQFEVGSAFNFSDMCPAHGVDLIIVGMAAHFFATDEFYDQVKRCLRPGGVLAIVSFWHAGFEHSDPKMETIITEFCLDNALDEDVLRTNQLLVNGYRDLYFPMANATRRETNLVENVSIEYVRQLLNSVHNLYEGGASTTNAFVDQLPSETTYRLKCNVFALFHHS